MAEGRRIDLIALDTQDYADERRAADCRDMRKDTRAAGSGLILVSELRKGEK